MNNNAIHLILLISVSIIFVTIISDIKQTEQTNHKLQELCDRLNVLEFNTDIELTDCDYY